MTEEKSTYLRNWLLKASNDVTIAQHELQHEAAVTDAVCFHCQQAVEKFLKAFLIFHDIEFGRTHNVYALLRQCCERDPEFCGLDLKDLNFFGVTVRYPDDFYMPSVEESQEYVIIAQTIKHLVETKLESVLAYHEEQEPDSSGK
jgi:HEPN domain-containing protein